MSFNVHARKVQDPYFAHSRTSLQKWVHTMFLRSERTGETAASRQITISQKTVIDFFFFLLEGRGRSVLHTLKQTQFNLGEQGIDVEIDVS